MKSRSVRHLRRQANLIAFLRENGGVTAVSAAVATPKSYISAITNGRRGLGDSLAEKIAREFDKPLGWFDEDHGHPIDTTGLDEAGARVEVTSDEHTSLIANERDATYAGPRIAPTPKGALESLSSVARLLRQVPRHQRGDVAARMSALALAPDSQELLKELAALLDHQESARETSARQRKQH